MSLKIDSGFNEICRELSKDEFDSLTQNIIDNGCIDSIKVWDGIIVDGHNRYKICQKHNIPFKTTEMIFSNRDDAVLWIINNQLSRRNLSPEERRYLIGKKYQEEKKEKNASLKQNLPSGNFYHTDNIPEKTAAKIAKEHNISEKTVRNAEVFAKAVDALPAEEKKEVLSGKKKLKTEKPDVPQKNKGLNLKAKGIGLDYAADAIDCLKRIPLKDGFRKEAFEMVRDFINDTINE